MGAQGKTTIDFGAFPGKSDTYADVVATGVVAASAVEAWIHPAATADHTIDEHMLETLKVFGVYISDNNIRVYGFNMSQLNEPVVPPRSASASPLPTAAMPAGPVSGGIGGAGAGLNPFGGGRGTRLYGTWTVAWVWN